MCRYALPQGKIKTMPLNQTDSQLAAMMFGKINIKEDFSDVFSPMPMGLFCKDKLNRKYQGENISGFSSNFCNDFYPVQNDVGFCTTKGFDVKKVIKYKPDYWDYMEAEKQHISYMNENGNRNSENTLFILTNVFDDPEEMTIIPRTNNYNQDVQFQINQYAELPQILHGNEQDNELRSLNLKPGYEYKIEVSPIGQMSTSSFHGLNLEQRNCRLSHEVEENSIFKLYTKRNCEHECRLQKAYETCKCIPWDFISNRQDYQECDLLGRTCFMRMIENMTHDSQNHCPSCIDECDKIQYRRMIKRVDSLHLEYDSIGKKECNQYLCFYYKDW